MNQFDLGQKWVLLGTAQASTDVWGLRRIGFPCGYSMPPGAFAPAGAPLARPASGVVWAMAGFSFELGAAGKNIETDAAGRYVGGYRSWLCLFHHNLLAELKERQHTVMVWDQGVSIFYGLWQEHSQMLGDLIPPDSFRQLADKPVTIEAGAVLHKGNAANEYAHDAAGVIHFMSQFMTLSPGDNYVLGPLAACEIPVETQALTMRVGDFSFSANIA